MVRARFVLLSQKYFFIMNLGLSRNIYNAAVLTVLLLLIGCGKKGLIGKRSDTENFKESVPGFASIGEIKKGFFKKEFIVRSIPDLSEPIRMTFKVNPLSKSDSLYISHLSRGYLVKNDTLTKRYTLTIRIADELALVKEINQNNGFLSYLRNLRKLKLLNELKLFFPPETSEIIRESRDCFLVQDRQGIFSLKLIMPDNKWEYLYISKAVLLDFETRSFCWEETNRGKIVVSGLRDAGEVCAGETVPNPEKLIQKDVFEKL